MDLPMEESMRIVLTIMAFVLSMSVVFAEDLTGTWKLNIEKSKLTRPMKEQTWKLDKVGNTYRLTSDTVRTDRTTHAVTLCDGQEHIDTNGSKVTCKVIDAKTLHLWGDGEGGRGTFDQTSEVSSDGKTLKTIRKAVFDSQPYQETLVYDLK
jgi:hypothetical protein